MTAPAAHSEFAAWLAERPGRGPRRLLFCAGCGAPAARDGVHLLGPGGHVIADTVEFPVVLANTADWDEQFDAAHASGGLDEAEDWVIANAPRPLAGRLHWTGQFRHGSLYAASPGIRAPWKSWRADDAWIVVFVTDEQIEAAVSACLRGHGHATAAEAGVTVAEIAAMLELPWSRP